jgi:hypothetical protein
MSDEMGSNRVALVHPARRAGVIALVAALLLAGLLLLERSGPSPVRNLRNISTGQPARASATGSVGQSRHLAPRSALPSRLNDASISAAGKSQLTDTAEPGETECSSFLAGTATTVSTVTYDTKGSTISKVITPGEFYYWVSIPVGTAGSQSFTITQVTTYTATTGTQYFAVSSGGSAYDGSCTPLATTITGGGASTMVSFTAAAPGTYVIGLKFSTHAVIGSSPASSTPGFSYSYTFSTSGVSGSMQGLSLTHV